MNKLILLFLPFFVFGSSIGIEQSYSNSKTQNIQKENTKTKSKEQSKVKTKELGIQKSKTQTKTKENSLSYQYTNQSLNSFSKSKKISLSQTINATYLMPEVDFLLHKVLKQIIKQDKMFPQTIADAVNVEQNYYIIEDKIKRDRELGLLNYSFLYKAENGDTQGAKEAYQQVYGINPNHLNVMEKLNAIPYILGYKIKSYLSNYFSDKFINISTYGKCELLGAGMKGPGITELDKYFTCDFNIKGTLNGNIFLDSTLNYPPKPMILSGRNFFINYNPQTNEFLFSYKNIPIVKLTPDTIQHFYGDIIITEQLNQGNVRVVDVKLNADGLKLNIPNTHLKFDSYFKKLMFIYLQALNNLKDNYYSIEEAKYRIREYIYKTFTGKNDFYYQYLNNPIDFWRPSKKTLLSFKEPKTSYGDILYDKKEGIILNRKIAINIINDKTINQQFSMLFANQRTRRFAESIQMAINQFKSEKKDFAVKLTKSLALKFVKSKNFLKKQDLINKASTSTDVLQNLLNLVK